MKKLLLIGFLFVACSKEDDKPVCVTCELNVDEVIGVGQSTHYIEETKQVCDDSYKEYNGKPVSYSISGKKTKTWNCK